MNKLFVSATLLVCLHFLFITLYAQDDNTNNICYQSNYACQKYETCCPFSDGNFGCCPYAYANCCPKVNACCQSGFICQTNGTGCVRSETNDYKATDANNNNNNN